MRPRILLVDDNAELVGLLARVFEDAGYDVIPCGRGREAMERAKADRPAAAVVDVLLPDVIGYEVASVLRRLQIPFILMSGVFKGGRHGLEAIQRHGAAEYFEKPFETDKLVRSLASLARPASASRLPVEEPVEVDVEVEEDPQGAPPHVLTGRVRVTEAPGRISATLRGEDIAVPARRPPAPPPPPDAPPPRPPPVMQPVAPPRTEAPAQVASKPATPPPGQRLGLLRDNLPQLISAFYLARETGELVLSRGVVRKTVFFEGGTPVFAVSNLATDRFGQFLVRTGKIGAEDLKAAALVADRSRRRTGDVLIEMGVLNETERMYYVGQQVKAIIYSLFAWEEGAFQLTFKNRAREEMLKLDIHPANLILRGVKKLYSPARLARLLPEEARPIPSQDPSYLLSDVELEGWEALLLSRVDGTRTAQEVIRLAQRPPEQVRGLIVGLMSLKILEIAS